MSPVLTHSIVQTAVVTRSRAEGVARMADLFAAVPIDLPGGPEEGKENGTVFAFNNRTNMEVLDPMDENHTRHRFLARSGPGAYMLSCSLQNEEWQGVSESLRAAGIRTVVEGPFGVKHLYRWHLHPKDAGGLLILTSIMSDREDNADWAGPHFAEDIAYNTRYVDEICGFAARTADPGEEHGAFGKVGFPMAPLDDGAMGWRGATGNVLELWPESAWEGPPVEGRRDYAVVIKASDREGLLRRMRHVGLTVLPDPVGGRTLTSVDPVLGVRFAIEP